ncbi:nucleotidyltransferase domain-containing protein [Asticcacaulis sp. DXS10W]|uniref:Nucleotidyltransferase domain-containing protein n=1 Tax=Asticcacaulis currens TaxID=2984210 RepID=A0ABT5IJE4_9CAUL|nr:nucleotidyltransferase domain-containing protein [Asticcacaulis currens]MDC7695591.1 nucleotidyltransferase domain-containing protein [Asticcacaulis currens]
MLPDALDHLPDTKRRELEHVVKVLFDSFEAATQTKLSEKRKSGRILKIILFGSYARGDWVEDRLSGYRSDYDLLVVVNSQEFTDLQEYWSAADHRFVREYTLTHDLKTPVSFIVHGLADVNDQLARGRPFFSDIVKDGVMLYEAEGHPLAKPKALTPEEIKAEAMAYYEQWMAKMAGFDLTFEAALTANDTKLAAFLLHQKTEALYHCLLLTLTLYSPKSHRLSFLRSQAEGLDGRLRTVWPDDKLGRRGFAKLQRAYVDARYSPDYNITSGELRWLSDRIDGLKNMVESVCMGEMESDE